MKRLLMLLLIVAVLCATAGCGGVVMNAEYRQLLDETAALSAETAARAQAGKLTTDEMAQALAAQAQTWQKFKDARDGRADDDAR